MKTFSIGYLAEVLNQICDGDVVPDYEDLDDVPIVNLTFGPLGGHIDIETESGIARFAIEVVDDDSPIVVSGIRH